MPWYIFMSKKGTLNLSINIIVEYLTLHMLMQITVSGRFHVILSKAQKTIATKYLPF